jgi:hypothetical protein
MRCYSVAHCRALLSIPATPRCVLFQLLVDCLLSIASPCNIAGLMRAGGHSEGSLTALRGTSIVVQAAAASSSAVSVATSFV